MKQVFFFFLAVALPILVLGGGLFYLVWHSAYRLYDDWRLNKELDEIRAESAARRQQKKADQEEDPNGSGNQIGSEAFVDEDP